MDKNECLKTEEELLAILPKQFIDMFQKKLCENKSSYWQTISELRTVVIFNKLGIAIEEIDHRTINNKNVDFFAVYNNERIYVEVKGFVPEDYDIAKKGGAMDAGDNKIRKALDRATPKFFDTACNILVIADEDTIKPPLFMNPLVNVQKTPEVYLNSYSYTKVSAIIILGGLYDDQLLKFEIWYSNNPQKRLPQGIIDIFNQGKNN